MTLHTNRFTQLITALAAAFALHTAAMATPYVVEDFNSMEVGTTVKMWNQGSNSTSSVASSAVVIADPSNPGNHVLKVTVKAWGEFVQFASMPTTYKGAALTSNFNRLAICFYRPGDDQNDWKQFHAYYGTDNLYADEGYPHQGDKGAWQHRTYALTALKATNTSRLLRLGIHSEASVYYIDKVVLLGADDTAEECMEHVTSYESGLLNLYSWNSADAYATYTTPTAIPEGGKLDVYTARYTDFNAPFYGKGTMNLYSGGERTYLGDHSSKKYPDWLPFSGDVHIYPNKTSSGTAGFYGVVMATNGKTFSPENIDECIANGQACNMLTNNKVFLHSGADIAFENGTRGAIYGELNTEAGSRIRGYYKNSANTAAFAIVGGLNTDATLAGQIAPNDFSGRPTANSSIGIIKDGKGTYTITGNNNCISAAIRVRNGRVDICNDIAAAEKGKLPGGTGTAYGTAAVAYVLGKGVLGGTGNIAGIVDVYGTLEPGTATQPGTLTMKDYVANAKTTLRMHPEGTLRFKIRSASDYDRLIVGSNIERSSNKEDFTTSDTEMPRVKIVLTDDNDISVGDEFTVITAAQRLNADTWKWRMVYPEHYTWKAEERRNNDGTYSLLLTVTSLEDDPGNTGGDNEGEEDEDEEGIPESFGPDGSTKTLRQIADEKGLRLGVAVATYNTPLDNLSNTSTQIVKNEFNMVVNENELKWDSCEPSQNSFNYGGGDALLSFAKNNKMHMRGHTLAWHSQVAAWVSADGKKNDKGWTKAELMAILKNHIMNVVGHYKGKIDEWDVVNECLDDDQSIVRSNPDGYKLRANSVWTTVCGEAFIDSAFVWAHRADPDAKLYLNDYGNETMGNAKAQAFYNLVKRLKRDGRPVDGVGFQCHLDAGRVNATAIRNNLLRYVPLGLECTLTELDLGIDYNSAETQQLQARDYYRLVKMASELPHCRSVLIWGISDNLSWRYSSPLLWDGSMQKKAAYYGVRQALENATASRIGDVNNDGLITIADANMIINHVVGMKQTGFNAVTADVNRDGIITIADANAIVNICNGMK